MDGMLGVQVGEEDLDGLSPSHISKNFSLETRKMLGSSSWTALIT